MTLKKILRKNKDFIKEIKKFEKQKNEEIESFRNNNIKLEEKNKQLMGILTLLESKLNYFFLIY